MAASKVASKAAKKAPYCVASKAAMWVASKALKKAPYWVDKKAATKAADLVG